MRVVSGRRVRVKKYLSGRYYAHYLGDKIICTPNPGNTQFTHVTNLYLYFLNLNIKIEKKKAFINKFQQLICMCTYMVIISWLFKYIQYSKNIFFSKCSTGKVQFVKHFFFNLPLTCNDSFLAVSA